MRLPAADPTLVGNRVERLAGGVRYVFGPVFLTVERTTAAGIGT